MTRAVVSFAAALSIALAVAPAAQRPARDAAPVPTTGTATISGVVVDDQEQAQPIRRVVITLTGPGLVPNRGAISDDNGRFRINNLPAGRFILTAARASFITSAFGAKRPGRPGTPIVVADGGTTTGLVVRLWRGAAVAGVVRDESGAPVAKIPVTAIPARDAGAGMPALSNNGVTTNELGEYRIFGLEPGTYVIAARPPSSGGPLTSMTDAQVDAALDSLRRGQPASAGSAPASRAPASDLPRPFMYAPIYHPGNDVIDQATPITLRTSEERLGLDIALRRVPTAKVSGTITRQDGIAASGGIVQLTRIVRPGPFSSIAVTPIKAAINATGSFQIVQVPPGEYRIAATPGPSGPSLWATGDVSVNGNDVSGLALTAGPGVTISGRVDFTSSQTPATRPPDISGLRVTLIAPYILTLTPNTPVDTIGFAPGVNVQPDGTFRIAGLLPDLYALLLGPGAIAAPWSPRSAMLGGEDLFDHPIELTTDMSSTPLVITYSDRRSELSGTLQTPNGAAVSDVFVIVYSQDRRFWTQRSRRVQAVRPGVDGRYVFPDLPPGEYFLGAVTDVDPDEWLDPGFLDGIVAASVKVSIAEGEKKVQPLGLRGGT